MEKIICDICATAYPASASECPVCGYPRQRDAKIVHHTDETPVETGEKTRVKGGRFSNKNVKKRQKEALAASRIKTVPVIAEKPEDIPEIPEEPKAPKVPEVVETPVVSEVPETPVIPVVPEVPETPETPETPEEPVKTVEDVDDAGDADDTEETVEEPEEENPNKNLLVIIALLLAAIVCVTAYIAIRFFWFHNAETPAETTTAPTTTAPVQTTIDDQTVACAALYLDASKLKLDAVGKEYRLKVTTIPADTTDELIFVSSDEAVATVSDDGVVTAVGAGQAEITITCGQVEVVCKVTCTIEEPTTAPTTVPTTAPTEPPVETTAPTQPASKELTLSHTDVTLFREGETFSISVKEGESVVSRIKVTWSSSDETVATVENGTVTAVAPGMATITASYNGKEATCVVRCRFKTAEEPEETEPTEPAETTKPTESEDNNWVISHTDVTLVVGEKFTLRIRNSAGQTAEVTWNMSNPETVTVNGNTVEAIAAGTVILTATVDDVEYRCIVRVKTPA